MGIKNLHQIIKPYLISRPLSAFKNHRIGIDGTGWLHIFLTTIASIPKDTDTFLYAEKYKNKNQKTENILESYDELQLTDKTVDAVVNKFITRINHFLSIPSTPVVVFDGRPLPLKADTQLLRSENRRNNFAKFNLLKKDADFNINKEKRKKAISLYKGSVSVKPYLLQALIHQLKAVNVEFVIAPYEADSQLAYMSLSGYIHSIVTEDSDLIVYGCNNILFKLRNGDYETIEHPIVDNMKCLKFIECNPGENKFDSEEIGHSITYQPRIQARTLAKNSPFYIVSHYSRHILKTDHPVLYTNILPISILSGCDYLPNLRRIGINTVIRLFETYKNLMPVFNALSEQAEMDENYRTSFHRAMNVFKYAVVYDCFRKKLCHFNGSTNDMNMDYLGSLDESTKRARITQASTKNDFNTLNYIDCNDRAQNIKKIRLDPPQPISTFHNTPNPVFFQGDHNTMIYKMLSNSHLDHNKRVIKNKNIFKERKGNEMWNFHVFDDH